MNRTELCARIAARSSLSRVDAATAATAVDAVVSAIADALERGGAVNITGFGKFTTRRRAARQGHNPAPGKPSPTPPAPCRLSRPACPFMTGSRISMARPEVRWPPFAREPLRGRVRPLATHPQRRATAGIGLRTLRRLCLRHGCRRHASSRQLRAIKPMRLDNRLWTRIRRAPSATLVAGRGRGNFRHSSNMRTRAQFRAGLESPRARVPHNAESQNSSPPILRASAQTQYRIRYPAAYGCHRSPTRPPHQPSARQVSLPSHQSALLLRHVPFGFLSPSEMLRTPHGIPQ